MLYANVITNEGVFKQLYDKYFVSVHALPETPVWKDEPFNEDFEKAKSGGFEFIISIPEKMVYKIESEDSVRGVSKLQTFGGVESFAFNKKMQKCIRLKWLIENKLTYVQYFSPVCHRMETLRILDNDNGGTNLPLKPFLMLKNDENMFEPYFPSNEDIFADDWIIVGHDLKVIQEEIISALQVKEVLLYPQNDTGVEEHI